MVKKLSITVAFSFIVWQGFTQVLNDVLAKDDLETFKSLNAQDSFLLHKAASQGASRIVDYLIVNSASVNQLNSEGNAPLHLAAMGHHVDIAEKLIINGADVNLKQGAGLNGTPLMLSSRIADAQLLNLLIDRGAEVNEGDKNGDPALNWATFYGCIPNIQLLLARGADLSIESKHGNAVDVGLRLWHADSVMEVFRKASFYDQDKKAEKIWSSIKAGDLIVRVKDPNMTDVLGTPILQLAAEMGNLKLVQQLLSQGADPNKMNRVGQVPLAFAARFGHQDIVKVLLEAGADPNLTGSEYKLTPMIGAAVNGDIEIAKMLIDAGAAYDEVDVINQSAPLHWAMMYLNHDFTSFILDKGADPDRLVMEGRFDALSLAEATRDQKLIEMVRTHIAKEAGILGSWKLDSITYITPDTLVSIKPGSTGAIVVSPGRYSIMYSQSPRPRVPFGILSKPTDEETIAGFRSIVFNSGSYRITDGDFVTTADIAKVPGFEGGIQHYRLSVSEGQLSLQLYDETYPDGGKPEWLGRVEIKMTFLKE